MKEKLCKCGHTILYHASKGKYSPCNFVKCSCKNYTGSEKAKDYTFIHLPKPKKQPTTFLGGFVYTEDEICKCGHGVWDHKYDEKKKKCFECKHITARNQNPKKIPEIGKCIFIKCKCKKFISKVKIKVKKVKRRSK